MRRTRQIANLEKKIWVDDTSDNGNNSLRLLCVCLWGFHKMGYVFPGSVRSLCWYLDHQSQVSRCFVAWNVWGLCWVQIIGYELVGRRISRRGSVIWTWGTRGNTRTRCVVSPIGEIGSFYLFYASSRYCRFSEEVHNWIYMLTAQCQVDKVIPLSSSKNRWLEVITESHCLSLSATHANLTHEG
jgi:hypothetical protein